MGDQRKALYEELLKVKAEEEEIENELRQYFSALSDGRSLQSKGFTFESTDLTNNINKIQGFGKFYEAMEQDAKKMSAQVEDCRALSDRLSLIVRRLDVMQIRAQEALAVTEDVINIKDNKSKLKDAIEKGDLPSAVNYIREVHDIGLDSAGISDDIANIREEEQQVTQMVQTKFSEAIENSDMSSVVSLCPLLQTLGLETDARDSFLDFMERTVFVAVSADASSVDDATDPATAYAQSLSNVFNSTYTILQQYLTMVIQGMENSLGDVYFIRKLHARCEQESGLVLKRYMKYRKIKDIIAKLQQEQATGTTTEDSKDSKKGTPTSSEIHAVLDELALLIQYCCMYARYLTQLCVGAESRERVPSSGKENKEGQSQEQEKILVFPDGKTTFEKMVSELINRYYMEGEQFLMKSSMEKAFEDRDDTEISGLDECFFVLQRCGHRAVATNNIKGACGVLHMISDLLLSDLLLQVTALLNMAVTKITTTVVDQTKKCLIAQGDASQTVSDGSVDITSVLKGASSLASSITGQQSTGDIADAAEVMNEADKYGLNSSVENFNVVEICSKYTERLRKEVQVASDQVFTVEEEKDKMKLCLEDFESVKMAYAQVLRTGSEQLVTALQASLRDVISFYLGRNGLMGGVKLELEDEQFDMQPAVAMLPKALVHPIEQMVDICTSTMSDENKDMIVGLMANACCEKIEQFIYQSTFSFAGALKLDECFRALSNMFSRYSTAPIRGKFSRLREICQALTADVSGGVGSVAVDTYSHLIASEVSAFIALRVDAPTDVM